MSRAWRAVVAGVVALALWPFAAARADERIVAHDSNVTIAADGTLDVVETIRVTSDGNQIKRGIFRDFPTDYRDAEGRPVRVAFTVTDAQRDGSAETFRSEPRGNGIRVYLGRGDVMLARGEHTYVLRYRTAGQLGFFDTHDELYWNATGNGWVFRIDAARARITMPRPVPAADLRVDGYVGAYGSRDTSVSIMTGDGFAEITASRAMAPQEGLTVVLAFPKGVIDPAIARAAASAALASEPARPMAGERTPDPPPAPPNPAGKWVAVIGFVLVWLGYLWRWYRVGRDPPDNVVIPEYEAPDGITPSVARYLRRHVVDQRSLTADIVHAAQAGYLTIGKLGDDFVLRRQGDATPPGGTIATLVRTLFDPGDEVVLDQRSRGTLMRAREEHANRVRAENASHRWHIANTASLGIGVLASAVVLLVAYVVAFGDARIVVAAMMTVVTSLVIGIANLGLIRMWHRRGVMRWLGIVALTLVLAFMASALTLVIWGLGDLTMALVVLGLVLANALFAWLLPAYTVEGRKLRDRIEGFAKYLGVAEKDDLARLHSPAMTGERFAALLPYAQALDVERAWAAKLEAALGAAAAAAATSAAVGTWYVAGNAFTPAALASSLGSSLGSAISSAATPPGSSSGSSSYSSGGGGGFSGGGGGGGGGGGW